MRSSLRRFAFFAGTFFFCAALSLVAQQQTARVGSRGLPPAVFEIRSISFQVYGRTRQWALRDQLSLFEGKIIAGELALLHALSEQQETLNNRRELDSVTVLYTLRKPAEVVAVTQAYASRFDVASATPHMTEVSRLLAAETVQLRGFPRVDPATIPSEQRVGVDVEIVVRDTWNIIALPYAKYDSNSGLLLALRFREYNFFGTLNELKLDLDYERTEKNENRVEARMNFSLPFNLLQQRWRLHFDQTAGVTGTNWNFRTRLGIGHDFRWFGHRWEARFTQGYDYLDDDPYGDRYFFSSRMALLTTFATPIVLGPFGVLGYNVEPFVQRQYKDAPMSAERDGIAVGLDQGLGAGRANWRGNYRHGQTLRVSNITAYVPLIDRWKTEFRGHVAVFHSLFPRQDSTNPRAGISARISGFSLITGAPRDQADGAADIRGVLNDRMKGDLGLFFNADATFTLWTLRPLFEAQVGTFFDVALVRDTKGAFHPTAFDQERDLKFGSGIEVIGFPLFARSLYVRASYGVDLREVISRRVSPLDGRVREIFIGIGHHY